MNGTIAVALYLVAIVMFGELLIDWDAASTWYKPILVLLLYDFGYYWLHRLLHVRKIMQKVHWVHHMNLHPTAVDSLYLHPVEMIAGLAFLLISIVIVGPLGIGAFWRSFCSIPSSTYCIIRTCSSPIVWHGSRTTGPQVTMRITAREEITE